MCHTKPSGPCNHCCHVTRHLATTAFASLAFLFIFVVHGRLERNSLQTHQYEFARLKYASTENAVVEAQGTVGHARHEAARVQTIDRDDCADLPA